MPINLPAVSFASKTTLRAAEGLRGNGERSPWVFRDASIFLSPGLSERFLICYRIGFRELVTQANRTLRRFSRKGSKRGWSGSKKLQRANDFFSRLAPSRKEDAVYARLEAARRHLRSFATPLPVRGMIMLVIKAAVNPWRRATSLVVSLTSPRTVLTVPCLSCFSAARIAAVKCTHKSGRLTV